MPMTGAAPIAAPGWTAQKETGVRIVDCDVHHSFERAEQLLPYLSKFHQEHLYDQGLHFGGGGYPNTPFRKTRNDLKDPDLKRRDFNFSLEFTQQELLDRWNIDVALLTGSPSDIYGAAGVPDPDWGAALCRAFNDYTLEHWVAKDPRLLMTIAVPVHAPEEAAAEIERIGPHPAAAAVMMPAGARSPFGNRFYDRIHAAAADQGLPIVTHFGGEGQGPTNAPTAAGFPSYYLEMRMARPQIAQAHSASLICEGVFERYPALRWLFVEVDTWWIPGLLWHFDADWKAVREYTPWVKRLPSEYFREHIRVGTQPLQLPAGKQNAAAFLRWMHAGEVLVYASDFPHWDWDEPTPTAGQFPKELREAVFGGNARELLGLD